MRLRLTRRAMTKILLTAPAALAAGPLACQTGGPRSAPQRLSPAEKKAHDDLARSVSRLKASVEKLAKMDIPVGASPAFHFTPLVAKK